jgi:histone arginine demethylase JMJD6
MGGWQERMEKARRLHRPSLEDWEGDNMHVSFPAFAREIEQQQDYACFNPNGGPQQKQRPVVLDAATLTREEFNKYEKESIPAVIRNIPAGYDGGEFVGAWPAHEKWQLKNLLNDETLIDRKFKCGEDDDGRNIKIRMSHFLSYTEFNRDDSPLYVFDSNFDDDKNANRILRDYRVPSYFREDLFGLVSESRRPPYRWFLIGPERSGTCVHFDPLGTSAWNTIIEGQKRWVLFPPHVLKSVVKGKGLIRDDEDDEAVHYFMNILPRIKREARSLRSSPKYENFSCYEFTQNAGETVFVPNGWWHAVLNLSHTVAVTQNFCSPRNFDQVWMKTRSGRKRMAWKWLCRLETEYPDLYQRARAMNEADGFIMKYEAQETEKEREERKYKEEKLRNKELAKWDCDSPSRKRGTPPKSSNKKMKRTHLNSRVTVSP